MLGHIHSHPGPNALRVGHPHTAFAPLPNQLFPLAKVWGLWVGLQQRGVARVALAQWEPRGGDLLAALSSTRVLLAVPSALRVPLATPEVSDPSPSPARPLKPESLSCYSPQAWISWETEERARMRFSSCGRCVLCVRGLWGYLSGSYEFSLSPDVSVLIAGGL